MNGCDSGRRLRNWRRPGREVGQVDYAVVSENSVRKMEYIPKGPVGLIPGLLASPLLMFVGETGGDLAGFTSLAGVVLRGQFLPSRGNVAAYRKDWRIMLALDAPMLFVVVGLMVSRESLKTMVSQGSLTMLSVCGETYAGAVLASVSMRNYKHPPASEARASPTWQAGGRCAVEQRRTGTVFATRAGPYPRYRYSSGYAWRTTSRGTIREVEIVDNIDE